MNKTKTYRVINDQNVHDYTIFCKKIKKGILYELYISPKEDWAEDYKNEKVLSIVDNGNGYKISYHIGKNIEYHKMVELYVLLSFIQHYDDIYKGSIIKVKEKHVIFI